MTILAWLAASSLVWGAVLWLAATMLQRSGDVSGRARQWIWRGATALLVAPWIAAPLVSVFGLGLAPNPELETTTVVLSSLPVSEMHGEDFAAPLGAAASAPVDLPLPQMLLILVAAGWIVRFVAAQLAARSLLGIVSSSRPADHGFATLSLQRWSRRLGLHQPPRLRTVASSVSPFSFGVLRPVICLPEGLEARLSHEALDLVVGHECLHVARGDGWRRPLERIAADLFWFNPFAWFMRRELDVARELACDEGVVELSSSRHAYARTLRDVAGLSAGLSFAAPAASMSLAGGGRSLMLRVTRTLAMAKRKPARAAVIAACLLGAVGAPIAVAQVMLATPRAPVAPAPPPAPPEAPEAPEALEAIATIEAPDAPEPPPAPQRVWVSSDGAIRASFSARVTATGGDSAKGYEVELLQTPGDAEETCSAELSGLAGLSVTKGQVVSQGAVIGTGGRSSLSLSVTCSDETDANGWPKAGDAPPPPVAPVAPVAPVEPASPVAAPLAPVAPRPSLAPTPPAPPAPVAPPARGTAVTPVAPVPPLTPDRPPPLRTAPQPAPVMQVTPAPRSGQQVEYRIANAPVAVVEAPARTTSGFGSRFDPFAKTTAFHPGVDLAAYYGAPIHAPGAGTVTFAGERASDGKVVDLDLGGGVQVGFGHLNSITVAAGNAVAAGEKVGTMGSTGQTTGPHLHFEVWIDGKAVDPASVHGLTLIGPG